ncbi:MAG: VanZ family protein [Devosia sp.]
MTLALRAIAWLALAALAFITLSPVGLRPHVAGPGFEYLGALAVMGGLFGLAYPKRPVLLAVLVIAAVIGLEASQMLTPDRHARLTDLAFKCAGALVGVVLGVVLARLVATLRS